MPSLVRCGVVLTAALSFLSLAGCSDDPSSSDNNNTVQMVKPGEGSSFVFSVHEIDEDHNVVSGSETTETMTVISSNTTLAGESNVYKIAGPTDTTYFSYQSNGDIKILLAQDAGDSVIAKWVTLPVGSKTAQSETLFSGNLDFGGVPFPVTVKWSAQHIGTANVTVGSETLAAQMIEQKIESTLGSSLDRTYDTLWVAPKIGFIAKESSFDAQSILSGSSSGEGRILTSYTLK